MSLIFSLYMFQMEQVKSLEQFPAEVAKTEPVDYPSAGSKLDDNSPHPEVAVPGGDGWAEQPPPDEQRAISCMLEAPDASRDEEPPLVEAPAEHHHQLQHHQHLQEQSDKTPPPPPPPPAELHQLEAVQEAVLEAAPNHHHHQHHHQPSPEYVTHQQQRSVGLKVMPNLLSYEDLNKYHDDPGKILYYFEYIYIILYSLV